jgi:hypothetical protein
MARQLSPLFAGALGGVAVCVIAALVFARGEPNRLIKRALGIPAELSGPHQYNVPQFAEVAINGSRDFAFCALSAYAREDASCELIKSRDGWRLRAPGATRTTSCSVTCLK